MEISLHPKLLAFVNDELKAGHFASPEHLINAAVAGLRTERELEEICPPDDTAYLREAVASGIAQADRGELHEWNPDEIFDEVERRYEQEKQKGD